MRIAASILLFGLLTACGPMLQAWRDSNCNEEGAYNAGFNEGQEGGAMQATWFVQQCGYDREPALARSYRQGYLAARQLNKPGTVIHVKADNTEDTTAVLPTDSLIRGLTNDMAAVAAVGVAAAAEAAKTGMQCIVHGGREFCGYNCIQSASGAACASRPEHRCVAAYGEIVCGNNCQADKGNIRCDAP